MTYDPFQTYASYATPAAYAGIGNPFQTLPFNAMQTYAVNPAAAWNPLAGHQSQQGYGGINPYSGAPYSGLIPQLQFTPQAAYWQNPFASGGLQHNVSHNPFLQHQLVAQQLAQQVIAQQLAAQQIAAQQIAAQQSGLYPQVGQIGFGGQGLYPLGQPGSAFNQIGMPLAPQSWVGPAGQNPGVQTNPILLAQLTARALQAQGLTPGTGFQG